LVQHDPAVHEPPHACPHDPQLFGSVCSLTQVPLQFVKLVLQLKPHTPELHVVVALATPGQATAVPQAPPEHVWTLVPEHCVWPGAHKPEHTPPEQVWLLHATAAPQLPLELHVCTPLPEHCVVPGTHVPMHEPPTQALFTHAVVPPKVPFDWQVWTLLPEQVV
jgi:hypothetical protein